MLHIITFDLHSCIHLITNYTNVANAIKLNKEHNRKPSNELNGGLFFFFWVNVTSTHLVDIVPNIVIIQ